jgi:hypothetical protein
MLHVYVVGASIISNTMRIRLNQILKNLDMNMNVYIILWASKILSKIKLSYINAF